MEMFITGLIIGISIGFVWGVWRATQGFIERIINQPEEIQEIISRVEQAKLDTDTPDQDVLATAELHQGVYYLYDNQDRFLAQGNTINEALNQAESRFNLKFRVTKSN